MHILHVIDSLAIGGAERMLVDLANATLHQGGRVSICVTRNTLDLAKDLDPEIPILVLGRRRRFDIKAMRRFAAFVKREHVQLFHVHGRSSFAFISFVKVVMGLSCPVILHDHHGGIEQDESVPLWFRLFGWRFVTQYVGVYSKLSQWAITAGVPATRVQTIGNAIDLKRLAIISTSTIRKRFSFPSDILIGVVICGIRYEKGIDLLIEGISRVSSSQQFKIIIIGRDHDKKYSQSCRKLIASAQLENRIELVGELANAATMLQGCDFGILPSRSESGPLVLIEYMASGLPIVGFEVGEISKKAKSYGLLGLVEPGDLESFASELESLLSLTREERTLRAAVGHEIAVRHFDISRIMNVWHEMYKRVLDTAAN